MSPQPTPQIASQITLTFPAGGGVQINTNPRLEKHQLIAVLCDVVKNMSQPSPAELASKIEVPASDVAAQLLADVNRKA